MATRDRIVVIGGGVIGVCSAYYLARQGVSAATSTGPAA